MNAVKHREAFDTEIGASQAESFMVQRGLVDNCFYMERCPTINVLS